VVVLEQIRRHLPLPQLAHVALHRLHDQRPTTNDQRHMTVEHTCIG
jgi:hypothetical protein